MTIEQIMKLEELLFQAEKEMGVYKDVNRLL